MYTLYNLSRFGDTSYLVLLAGNRSTVNWGFTVYDIRDDVLVLLYHICFILYLSLTLRNAVKQGILLKYNFKMKMY